MSTSVRWPTNIDALTDLPQSIRDRLWIHLGGATPRDYDGDSFLMHSKLVYIEDQVGRVDIFVGSHNWTINALYGINLEAGAHIICNQQDSFAQDARTHIQHCCMASIKRLKEGNGRITYLTTDQISRLIEAAKQDHNPYIYLFVIVGLETSMRRMEILSIRLEHIDLQRCMVYIPQAKAGAREQPITKHLADILKGYIDAAEPGQEWLFPAPKSKTGHAVAIEKAFRRVVRSAGLDPEEVVRHTLRHTAITHLVQAGVDLPTVQRISGHKTLQMVVRYSHQNGEHIQSAMDKLEKRYKKPSK